MPAESRPGEVAALCGDSEDRLRFIDRGQRSGNQARARRVPMDQEGPAGRRDDCVGAGLRDEVIAGPILMPVYVCLPSSTKHSSTIGVIMLGAGSTRFHA